MTPREELATAECVRHVKRGSLYVVRSMTACLQSSGGPVSEGAELVVYQSIEDGRWWARPRAEFEDGRFIAAGYRKVEAGRDARETAQALVSEILKEHRHDDPLDHHPTCGSCENKVATAITAAVEAQRERDCLAVCKHCKAGVPLSPYLPNFHTNYPDDPTSVTEICAAAAIREG